MISVAPEILDRVKHPASYLGCEVGAYRKTPPSNGVHWVLAFPDAYEIGVTHLGYQIIYHVLNEHASSAADRIFAPWDDFSSELKSRGKMLCSLEKGFPLRSFDVIGFSLAYELGYTNVLQMLSSGGVPIRSAQRVKGDPLVVAGGICASNPEPMAAFIDAFVVGDGEEAAIEITEKVRTWKESKSDREALLDEIASINGVYVPSRWGEGRIIHARRIPDLDSAPFPVCQVVPSIEAVHDRAVVEIARGCPHSCRFCQAGFVYRPLRERSPEKVVELAKDVINKTGYSDLTLLALSAGDYPSIIEVIRKLLFELQEQRTAINLPSLRAGSLSPEVIDLIRSVRKTGFTIAPEAGSERLRRVINKGLSDEEILGTARTIYKSGWNLLKLYFMFGLPTETEEDLEAIAKLVRQVRETGFEAGIKPNINVGLSAFVPKSHTPFQWEPMLNTGEIRLRLDFLRQRLKIPGVKASWSDPRMSLLEGVMSRGDRHVADLIERAWRLGAGFDGWGEHLKWEAWERAFREIGIDPEVLVSKTWNMDDPLPWDHIRVGASKKYLLRERERAFTGAYSAGCGASDKCEQNCGGCATGATARRAQKMLLAGDRNMTAKRPHGSGHVRYRLIYGKTGPARYLGHLDTVRAVHQSLRRAGLPVRYSEGFHPMPRTRFGNPLPVGVASLVEVFDLDMEVRLEPEEIKSKINSALPEGMEVTSALEIEENSPAPQAVLRSVRYRFVPGQGLKFGENFCREGLRNFLEVKTFPMRWLSKGRVREIDLREAVMNIDIINEKTVEIEMACNADGVTPRPHPVWDAIFGPMPFRLEIDKVAVTTKDETEKIFQCSEAGNNIEEVELSKENLELRIKNVE